ncbi:MAG: TCR/Tet family MFS transporter [Vicinamibacterales bacterium]|jgi:DHA1 family tetracycline resistance protein-like MFS transporter|nr:TCR/Tet family MFS transporter [Vicinamibacterales bacterium]
MAFILVTLFIDILGIGIIVPILPVLIREFLGGNNVQAAVYYGVIISTYATMQFLCAPVLGALSDRYGRRPVILVSLFGLGIDYLIQGWAPSIGWLFLGRIIAGIMGASITTANAYIADVSTPQTRAQNFGFVGAAFGLGFIFGPVLGGLLGAISLRLPFFVAAGLALVNWLYGFFVLPESLAPEHRSTVSWRKMNPLASLRRLGTYPLVAGLAVAFLFATMAQRGLENVWILYTGFRYGWDLLTNGLTLGLVGVMAVLVQGLLIKPIVARIGERRSITLGLTVSTLAFLAYGLASQGWMVSVIIVFGALAGVALPTIQGLVAGTVLPSEQGKIHAAFTSLTSLTAIFSPLIFTAGLFSFFTSAAAPVILPGAPFFLGSLLFLVSLGLLVRLFRRLPATPVT